MRAAKFLKPNFSGKVVLLIFVICYLFGVFTFLFEESYEKVDQYFLPDILMYIKQLEKNHTPIVKPINFYNYSFINNNVEKCSTSEEEYPLRLVYIVKSSIVNFGRREAIRKSWGFEKRFSDVTIRTVFVLGLPSDEYTQFKINEESRSKGDIIQASFIDSYFNNTIKTMVGFNWAVSFCQDAKFYFFADDDYYISTKNLLKFLRNPLEYPAYLDIPFSSVRRTSVHVSQKTWPLSQVLDIELPDKAELFAGYMFPSSRPHRHFSSKWYVSLNEYPFSRYPPYITAGAYVLSKTALKKLYYASFYVKHFRFDDIYLSLLAKASQIVPVHSDEFHFYKKPYDVHSYRYVVASHGYDDSQELLKVWTEQKSVGYA